MWPICLAFILSFFHALRFFLDKREESARWSLAFSFPGILQALYLYIDGRTSAATFIAKAGVLFPDDDPVAGLIFLFAAGYTHEIDLHRRVLVDRLYREFLNQRLCRGNDYNHVD